MYIPVLTPDILTRNCFQSGKYAEALHWAKCYEKETRLVSPRKHLLWEDIIQKLVEQDEAKLLQEALTEKEIKQ